MSKLTTKATLVFLLFISFASTTGLYAQTASTDTAFKPGGKLWGLAFADYFYKSHADSLGRGSYQYSKIAKNTNAFQYRRIYLGYNYDISPSFSVELLLAAENDVTSSSTTGVSVGGAGDVLQDNSFAPYIKLANLRWKNIWKGTDLVVGQQSTPLASQISEPAWGYRNIEKTIGDFNKSNTYDLGVSLQGKFDPATNNFGYDLMIGNGTKATPETDNYKWLYGDIWGKFINKKLWIDLYVDYNKIGYTGSGIAYPHSRNMIKGTVAYVSTPFTIGVEAFINNDKNDVQGVSVSGTTKDTTTLDATGQGISAYARGQIIKDKLGFFVRYDNFNPDSKYDNTTYTTYLKPSGNVYDPNTKTEFFTAGFDITPTKNVHFEPNVWYARYAGQQANLVGAAVHDHDLVWRMTFYFVFGK
jgi:hypothetical protein